MREVNFSVPAANRASTGITTALYDRRALDCTSTLPLINSLNHLAYLTLSSPRIRQILTLDGGVERLVSMLKKGKSRNILENWKWHLALQCIVNIGVRGSDARASDAQGSESIRTRVVEADIVPVIATILHNYMQMIDKQNSKFKERERESRLEEHGRHRSMMPPDEELVSARLDRRRPPPIDIPQQERVPQPTLTAGSTTNRSDVQQTSDLTQAVSLSSPPGQSVFFRGDQQDQQDHDETRRHHHRQNRSEALPIFTDMSSPVENLPQVQQQLRDSESTLHPRRTAASHIDRSSSQPDTPTTPTARPRPSNRRRSISTGATPTRRNLRQTSSMSGDSDEGETTVEAVPTEATAHDSDPDQGMQVNGGMDIDMDIQRNVLEIEPEEDFVDPQITGDDDNETFNIRHRSVDGSLVETETQPVNPAFAPVGVILDPATAPENSRVMIPPAAPLPQDPVLNMATATNLGRIPQEDVMASGLLAWIPHDEDVTMSLQLLAYVSKYCTLRSYFQNSHLVPSLKMRKETLNGDDLDEATAEEMANEQDEEYCQPDDFNIFPLVENFTVRHYSADMKYWACVVMRNLCRKDKTRGDIRQCAYYKCGKWEEYARQFAKCRRCRQTKYCSKDCQKNAWVFHRHWCEPARESYQRHSHGHSDKHHHQHHSHRPQSLHPHRNNHDQNAH